MIYMYKTVKAIAAAAAVCTALTACGTAAEKQTKTAAPEVTGEYKTTILKSGKADAIVLKTQDHTVVIDTGEKDDGDEIIEYLKSSGISEVDYLIITHYDQDHIGGAPELMAGVKINEIIVPDYEGNNFEYTAFTAALSSLNITPTRLTANISFTLDDVLFELYPAQKSQYKEEDNDYSIVTSVTHGKNTFLYAGDCETARLSELPDQMDMSHTFLKVPHHGVYCSGTDEFIKSVSPGYAVITDTAKNPADEKTLALLEAAGTKVYSTQNGSVTAVSNGTDITVTQG